MPHRRSGSREIRKRGIRLCRRCCCRPRRCRGRGGRRESDTIVIIIICHNVDNHITVVDVATIGEEKIVGIVVVRVVGVIIVCDKYGRRVIIRWSIARVGSGSGNEERIRMRRNRRR